jgi:hypothetical protein
MSAPYLAAAIAAPLADRPNHQVAEIRFIAERDRFSLFEADLQLLRHDQAAEPELGLQ